MNRAHFIPVSLLPLYTGIVFAVQDGPTDAARRVAVEITREATRPPSGPEGRPLPLASHWNTGTVRGSFEPDHQIGLIQNGHHILPWMAWPDARRNVEYSNRLLRFFAQLNLPISIRGTQWNRVLVTGVYKNAPEKLWAGVIRPDGTRAMRLSPFGSVEAWKTPASVYVNTAGMKRAQELYPNPPLVLWVSNNEAPELRWAKNGSLESKSKRYLELYGTGRSDEFKRQVVGEGWIERYNVMFDAMRHALLAPAWKENVRFIGYGAFGPSHFGRNSLLGERWKVHSLITDEWTAPHWYFWEGASPSYYTHNWSEISDYTVFSKQIESMNWVFMQQEALRANPNHWFEMSTWDGNNVAAWMTGLNPKQDSDLADISSLPLSRKKRNTIDREDIKKSKTLQYMIEGQDYPPERSAGWVQFGMWLLRPRVVREFRGHATPLNPVKPYWMETIYAVDRVWNNDTLATFWRFGELVENNEYKHPYQTGIPDKYSDIPRWYLLDTNLDKRRPWNLKTQIPVFSLALVRGKAGARSWLLYAHSPLQNHEDVTITIPEFGEVTVDVPRSGAFYIVTGGIDTVSPVEQH